MLSKLNAQLNSEREKIERPGPRGATIRQRPQSADSGPYLTFLDGLSPRPSSLAQNGTFTLPNLSLRNDGHSVTGNQISVRYYFSAVVAWQPVGQILCQPMPNLSEPEMRTELYCGGSVQVSPGETWHFQGPTMTKQGGLTEPSGVKIKIFYGGGQPAEGGLVVEKQFRTLRFPSGSSALVANPSHAKLEFHGVPSFAARED